MAIRLNRLLLLILLAVHVIRAMEFKDEDDDYNAAELASIVAEQAKNEELDQEQELTKESKDDDLEGRNLIEIQLFTTDERCNNIGVCSGFNYSNNQEIVSFGRKPEIRFTSETTYRIKEGKEYSDLTFINSQFSNFPLNLFYAFRVKELDFRNCSVETLKWDNFLMADKLTILLLSENLLKEIKPMLFTYAENLSFLFLDSNLISKLHNDSFKGLEKLIYLDLHNNLIETLPLSVFNHLPALQQLNLAGNRLKIIEEAVFAGNPHLFSIYLQNNQLEFIEEYSFQEQELLKYLDVSHNSELKLLVNANIRVEYLWAKNCSLRRINIYGTVVNVDLQQNRIIELYFTQPEYLETLNLRDNSLEQISSLARSNNLRTLDISDNPNLITFPDLWQINALERLDMSNTSLKEIPIAALASPNRLRSLNVSFNQLEEINPLNFKYFEKLSHFYIHHNNWNCFNLQILMDILIKPLQISYTYDEFDDNFPGEYIQGIKCMYRIREPDDAYETYAAETQQELRVAPENIQEYNQLKFDNVKEVEKLRREFKAIIGIYEEKFSLILNKLNDLDIRIKQFEQFNQTMWKQVSIVV